MLGVTTTDGRLVVGCHAMPGCLLMLCACLQKYSQQRELQRQLRRFIVTGADFHSLLLHLLRELVREERNNMRLLGNMEDEIVVPTRCAPAHTTMGHC